MSEKVALSVLEVLPAPARDTAVCIVRCVMGTAVLGMRFDSALPGVEKGTPADLRLVKIEWYGREVEQLDTVHSAKVTLTGEAAESLAPGSTLTSVPAV